MLTSRPIVSLLTALVACFAFARAHGNQVPLLTPQFRVTDSPYPIDNSTSLTVWLYNEYVNMTCHEGYVAVNFTVFSGTCLTNYFRFESVRLTGNWSQPGVLVRSDYGGPNCTGENWSNDYYQVGECVRDVIGSPWNYDGMHWVHKTGTPAPASPPVPAPLPSPAPSP